MPMNNNPYNYPTYPSSYTASSNSNNNNQQQKDKEVNKDQKDQVNSAGVQGRPQQTLFGTSAIGDSTGTKGLSNGPNSTHQPAQQKTWGQSPTGGSSTGSFGHTSSGSNSFGFGANSQQQSKVPSSNSSWSTTTTEKSFGAQHEKPSLSGFVVPTQSASSTASIYGTTSNTSSTGTSYISTNTNTASNKSFGFEYEPSTTTSSISSANFEPKPAALKETQIEKSSPTKPNFKPHQPETKLESKKTETKPTIPSISTASNATTAPSFNFIKSPSSGSQASASSMASSVSSGPSSGFGALGSFLKEGIPNGGGKATVEEPAKKPETKVSTPVQQVSPTKTIFGNGAKAAESVVTESSKTKEAAPIKEKEKVPAFSTAAVPTPAVKNGAHVEKEKTPSQNKVKESQISPKKESSKKRAAPESTTAKTSGLRHSTRERRPPQDPFATTVPVQAVTHAHQAHPPLSPIHPAGHGAPLGSVTHVHKELAKRLASDATVQLLHRLLFGRVGEQAKRKENLRKFNGLASDRDSEQLKAKLDKLTVTQLHSLAILLNLERGGDKNTLAGRIASYLVSPQDMGASKAVPVASRSGAKKKSAMAGKGAKKGKASSTKKQNKVVAGEEAAEDNAKAQEGEEGKTSTSKASATKRTRTTKIITKKKQPLAKKAKKAAPAKKKATAAKKTAGNKKKSSHASPSTLPEDISDAEAQTQGDDISSAGEAAIIKEATSTSD